MLLSRACHSLSVTYVLVHGGGFSGSCWDELLPYLDDRVIAIDLPGRGARPADLHTLTIADFVAAVVDEVVREDLTDVTLVGHSMAGLTLPGVAESVPTRLRHLVFISCAVPPHGTSLDGRARGDSARPRLRSHNVLEPNSLTTGAFCTRTWPPPCSATTWILRRPPRR